MVSYILTLIHPLMHTLYINFINKKLRSKTTIKANILEGVPKNVLNNLECIIRHPHNFGFKSWITFSFFQWIYIGLYFNGYQIKKLSPEIIKFLLDSCQEILPIKEVFPLF